MFDFGIGVYRADEVHLVPVTILQGMVYEYS
jgi:hypothetical protein